MDLLASLLVAYTKACHAKTANIQGYHCNYQQLAVAYNGIVNLLNHNQQMFDGYSRNCPRLPDNEGCRFYRDAVGVYHYLSGDADSFPRKYPLSSAAQLKELYTERDE